MNKDRFLNDASMSEDIFLEVPNDSEIDDEINAILDMNEEDLDDYLIVNGVDIEPEISKIKGLLNGKLFLFPSEDFSSRERLNNFLNAVMKAIIDTYVKGSSGKPDDDDSENESENSKKEEKEYNLLKRIKEKLNFLFVFPDRNFASAFFVIVACGFLVFSQNTNHDEEIMLIGFCSFYFLLSGDR